MESTPPVRRVLIIDDNDLYRGLLVQWFRQWERWHTAEGHPGEGPWLTAEAASLPDALTLLQAAHETHQYFSLVVLDLKLPGVKGLEGFVILQDLCRTLTQPGHCPPILLITGSLPRPDFAKLLHHISLYKQDTNQASFYAAVTHALTDHAHDTPGA